MDEFRGELQQLFETYRRAHPDPEPSANFMPRLWERIDSRRSAALMFRRLTHALVSLSAAAALFLGVFLIPNAELASGSYADIVADDSAEEQIVAAAAPLPHSQQAQLDEFQGTAQR